MYNIEDNLAEVLSTIPGSVQLVAVSKYHAEDDIQRAYACGQRIFGESHVQELSRKQAVLPADIKWHFIGHLQTNKVKYIVPYISMIEAVDSVRLLHEIEKQASRVGRVVDILLELHIAEEETKYGFSFDECRQFLAQCEWQNMEHVRIRGLMMMASYTDNVDQIRSEMMSAADFFDEMKAAYFADVDYFDQRSWGMSHDYKIALACRSTMVRVGTKIFGPRQY